MNHKICIITALGLTISACGSLDNKRALGDFDYAEKEPAQPLSIPSDLTPPPERKDFEITSNINTGGPIGEQVDIRSPSLVLPIAESSRVVENNGTAEIWFDQVFDDMDLQAFIVSALEEQLALDDVELTNAGGGDYQSQWYENTVEKGFWFLSYDDTVSRVKFSFKVTAKPHGRSVSLYVKLSDFENIAEPEATEMDQIDQQRAEMAMLNSVVARVNYKYRVLKQQEIRERAAQKIVAVAINSVDEPAYLIRFDMDEVWQHLPYFFERYGFTVNDISESKKIYSVNFEKPDNSLWAVVWGDDIPVIDVADEKYQFVLEESSGNTLLTIYNSQGVAITEDVLTRILPVMEPGLTIEQNFR